MSLTVTEDDVLSLMFDRSCKYRDRAALSHCVNGSWADVSFEEVQQRALCLSNLLNDFGIERGDKVAILSESSPDWGIALFASVRSGAIVVPLDIKLTVNELNEIAADCLPRVIFASDPLLPVARQLQSRNPFIEYVFALSNFKSRSESEPKPKFESGSGSKSESGFDSHTLPRLESQPKLHHVARNRHCSETALFVYTSGTTTKPKGVMVSFGTLIFQIQRIEEALNTGTQDVFLSVLPMNHLLELTCGFMGPLYFGSRVCFAQSLYPQDVLSEIRAKRVTWMIAVPALLNSLQRSVQRQVKGSGNLSKAAIFGEQFRGFFSGGAPLDLEVADFFTDLGVIVCQGYGLTETGPILAVNTPADNRRGSVGRPWPGIEVKIGADHSGDLSKDRSDNQISRENGANSEGEILTRGIHVMQGYYGRPDLTGEAVDADGWFHTGDLGKLDSDGYLYITGRLKNLIVTPAGKKVQPEEVEEVLRKSNLIKDIIVLGETVESDTSRRCGIAAKEFPGAEEVVAVVVPNEQFIQVSTADPPAAQMALREDLTALATELAAFKRPQRIYLHNADFPQTTSCKVRRNLVAKWLKTQEAVRPWI